MQMVTKEMFVTLLMMTVEVSSGDIGNNKERKIATRKAPAVK